MQRILSLDVYDYSGHALCSLYDSTNDLSGQATEVIVHTERNGFKELRFKLPSTYIEETEERNYRLDYLVSDYKIRFREVKDGEEEIDWFLISESKVTHSALSTDYEIRAGHISQLLNTKNLNLEFSDEEGNNVGTIGEIAATILEGTSWHLGEVASFKEEDKYAPAGKEKVRSFTASAKTGAFKMMSDLCELFDAKPIYHGDDRSVDIIPMNPFSEKLDEGVIPPDLNKKKVIELYYDKNVRNITRTLNTENLVTVFSAYGSYGDLNGMASRQTAEHAEITFGALEPGKYHFVHQRNNYYFETDIPTNGLKWSSLDFTSRSYLYDGEHLFKVYKEPFDSYVTLEVTPTYVKNQVPYIYDFTYYDKIGLLSDEMLLNIARAQAELPQKHIDAQEASIELSRIKEQLSNTASAGNGFLMLDISASVVNEGHVVLTIDKTTYPGGVVYRSDYDEAKRNYFTWNTATGIKSNGEAIAGKGAVVYVVHPGSPTTWEKSYVKALGNGSNNYYRDSLGNIYELIVEQHYDRKEYSPTYPEDTVFPVIGEPNIIYVADNTTQSYAWVNNDYVEVQASSYFYGLNEFPEPNTITLWSTDSTWHEGDKVYLFSADSIAGVFGPREDAIFSNRKSIEESTKVATEVHPLYFIKDNELLPSTAACENSYGWVYRSYTGTFNYGKLYFMWGKAGEVGWSEVLVSFGDENPELITPTLNYYYSLKRMMLYRLEDNKYRAIKDTVDENEITKGFTVVIDGCITQEMLTKGVSERYNYSGSESSLPIGNYAFKNEYGNYWLFTTDRIINNPSLVHYMSADKILWQDDDEDHILKAVERSFRHLEFPKNNELYDSVFTVAGYENETFVPTGDLYISNNIYVHDNVSYEFNLPANAKVVCLSQYQKVLAEYVASPFVTPNHTTHVRIVSPAEITDAHYFRVSDYTNTLFSGNIKYQIIPCAGAGEKLGITYLMDKFLELSHDAYEVKLPALQQAQQEITDINLALADSLKDMYREGYWQENNYVEGDEEKLYTDALDNLKEISHPQATYEVDYLDLYEADENMDDDPDVEWPDIDIEYAVHLVDMDIDTNRWAYIDSIDKCYDQPWKTQIEINTQLSMIGQQSFTDVLSKIAEVANQTKAKQTIYEKANAINGAGQFAADKLEGLLQANKVYLMGGTSNWYTDPKGNIIFEAADGNSAMMLTGRGLCVASSRDEWGDWDWQTALSGNGFNADVIATGEFSAKHITAGTITTDKLASSVGQELEIGSNKALTLYATADGSRPAGSLITQHPDPTDSWIEIAAESDDDPAHIDIQSGGAVHIYGGTLDLESGSQMNLASEGSFTVSSGARVDIQAGGEFLVNSPNFKILKDTSTTPPSYNVIVTGEINTTGGHIAGYTIGQTSSSPVVDYMYCGNTTSINSTNAGVYIGTDGLNLGGGLVYKHNVGTANGPSLDVKANSVWIGESGQSPQTYFQMQNGALTLNAAADINLTSVHGSISIASNDSMSLVTNGTIVIGKTDNTFKIGSHAVSNVEYAYIQSGVRSSYDDCTEGHGGVYLGTDGISLGIRNDGTQAEPVYVIPFKVSKDGELFAANATIEGTITAKTGYIADWTIDVDKLYSGSGTDYVALCSTTGDYRIWAGDSTASSAPFYVKKDGSIHSTKGDIAGWTINDTSLTGNKTGMAKTTDDADIAFWAGNSTASSGTFKVTQGGALTCTDATITGGSIEIKNGNTTYFKASSSGAEINGSIKATALYIGSNNLISSSKLSLNTSNCTLNANLIDISGKTISISQVSGLQGSLDNKYTTVANISIANGGITLNGKTLSLTGSSSISMSGGNITMSGGNITMSGGTLQIDTSTNKFVRINTWYLGEKDGKKGMFCWESPVDDMTFYKDYHPYYSNDGSIQIYRRANSSDAGTNVFITREYLTSSSTTMQQAIIFTYGTASGYAEEGLIGSDKRKIKEGHFAELYYKNLHQTSSVQFKKNIKTISDQGEKIDKLNPVSFEYKNGSGKLNYGFIAEEIIKVMPALCDVDKLSISTIELIPVLVKEIQSLRKRVKALEGQ